MLPVWRTAARVTLMALPEDRRRMVGERLAKLREQKALTLHDLEELSGVGADGISKIENGHRKPRPSTLRKLAGALGVDVEDLSREAAFPLVETSREAGQAQPSTQDAGAWERTLAYVMEPVVAEALKEQQAANRFLSSGGRPQDRVVDPPEAEAGKRFLNELSREERPIAFAEVALGRARFERDNAALEQSNAALRKLLRERDQKIARLEEENAQLRKEQKRVEAEKARTEAEK
jgi:transcriptional regulator with XRE-family HTH domain